MGKSNKVCPRCGRKMKCQFNGLQHCKCGISWIREEGFFERTPDMIFCLKRVRKGKGPHTMQVPEIRYRSRDLFADSSPEKKHNKPTETE